MRLVVPHTLGYNSGWEAYTPPGYNSGWEAYTTRVVGRCIHHGTG